jgi:hypothetical protein
VQPFNVDGFFDAMNDQHDLVLCLFALDAGSGRILFGYPAGSDRNHYSTTLSRPIIVQIIVRRAFEISMRRSERARSIRSQPLRNPCPVFLPVA